MDARWWLRLGAGAFALVAAWPAIAQPVGTAKGGSAAAPNSPTPSVTLPRVKVQRAPVYPEQALREGLRSIVKVELTVEIDAEGKVQRATVVTPRGHGFDEAAVEAAEGTTFEPARKDGAAIAAKIRFEIVFTPPAGETKAPGPEDAAAALKGEHGSAVGPEAKAPEASQNEAPPPAPVSPQPVVDVSVYGERAPREVTKRTLTMDEIGLIPGTNGDALRSLQSMPGVARTLPASGLLVVRGAAPRDTNYMVDGTPVPIVYHLGGLSSVLPTEVLSKIDFYPGNYSDAYGRRIGGLVDVGIRSPRDDGIHALAQLDLIDARALVEAPVWKTGWKVLAAGRRSWFDAWLTPILEATSQLTATSVYYDYQLIVQNDLTPTSSLRLLFFGSDDRVQLVNEPDDIGAATSLAGLDYHTSFWRIQARYQNRISDRTEIRAVLAGGQDTEDDREGEARTLSTSAPVSGRLELSQRVARGVVANVGIDVLFGPYAVQIKGASGVGDQDIANGAASGIDRSGFRFLAASYTEWEIRPWLGMRVVPGLRLDYSSTTKSWDVSPRLLVRQDLTRGSPRTTLKGGVGLFYQPPSAFETDPVLGKPGLVSNRALQTDIGVEQELTPQLELSVDVYHRKLDDLVTQRLGNFGEGTAFGAEWLLRYKPDERFFGWLAYTISRSEQRSFPDEPPALTVFDQTHILTILGSYALPYGFRAGLRFRLVSGNPYSRLRPGAYDATTGRYSAVQDYPPNQSRLPLFHDLNLRVDKRFQFKSWALTAYLDVQNVYNQSNVEGLVYNSSYTRHAEVYGLPIIPSLGLRGEL